MSWVDFKFNRSGLHKRVSDNPLPGNLSTVLVLEVQMMSKRLLNSLVQLSLGLEDFTTDGSHQCSMAALNVCQARFFFIKVTGLLDMGHRVGKFSMRLQFASFAELRMSKTVLYAPRGLYPGIGKYGGILYNQIST